MRKLLIDGGSMALAVALLAGLGSLVRLASEEPAEAPEALDISAHTATCALCRLPRTGSAGRPSMLGPGPSLVHQSSRGPAEAADEWRLINRADPPAGRGVVFSRRSSPGDRSEIGHEAVSGLTRDDVKITDAASGVHDRGYGFSACPDPGRCPGRPSASPGPRRADQGMDRIGPLRPWQAAGMLVPVALIPVGTTPEPAVPPVA